jgi:ribosome biogenesis GTPase A
LLEAGVVKAIFSNLQGFKDYDAVLSEIYGYLDASYNFKYLTDSIQVLQNILNVTSGISNLNEYATVLRTLLEQANFDKLKSVLDTIFVDIKDKKIEYTQLSLDIHTVKFF